MKTVNLSIYINDILYRNITVPSSGSGRYDSRPLMMEIFDQRAAGKLSKFNVDSGLSVRIEVSDS